MRGGLLQFPQSLTDHLAGYPSGFRYRRDATGTPRFAFCHHQQPARFFVQHSFQNSEPLTNFSKPVHTIEDNSKHQWMEMLFTNSSLEERKIHYIVVARFTKWVKPSVPT
jgi:hypothetical protein